MPDRRHGTPREGAGRDARIAAFLAAHGWGGARRRALAADASFRRYERIARDGDTAVLMDAPPPHEDVRPFARLAGHLRGLGLSAPEVRAADPQAGLLLLEDLGDATFTRVLEAGAGDEAGLYERALDVLIDLHRRPASEAVPEGLPPYDAAALHAEVALFADWYLPAVLGEGAAAGLREDWLATWAPVLTFLERLPRTLVLRDYHVDNLMWLPEREGVARVGLLDFQDALAGPAAYDVVSLIEDARRDVSPGVAAGLLGRYHAAFPDLNRAVFGAAYAALGAQRHAKVIGIFTRLCRRDGKPEYLRHIPRVWRLLTRSARHPMLATLADWLDRNVPEDARRTPECSTVA